MRSTQSSSAPGVVGDFGFYVSSPVYVSNYLRYNVMTNVKNGIVFNAGLLTSKQLQGAINADYNYITANFGGTPSTQFVSNAIAIDNVFNCYLSTNCNYLPNSFVTANNNTILDVWRGIEMTNWVHDPYIFANNNYISLRQDIGTLNTQFGINANSCEGHFIENNNVHGFGTGNLLVRGIYSKDNFTSVVDCNYTQNVGKGFEFEGQSFTLYPSNNTMWQSNTMIQNQRGFELTNNCTIGQQGYPFAASDNKWLGTWSGSNFGTYMGATMPNGTAPQIYIQSTSAPYYPQNCFAQFTSNDYCNTPSLLPVGVPSNYACPSLPTAPCFTCQLTSKPIMENAVQDNITYAILPAENTYRVKLRIFKAMRADSTLGDSSTILNTFYNTNQNSNISLITDIENNLSESNISVASSQNTILTPTNQIENNYKDLFTAQIHLSYDSLTPSDSSNLIKLANLCPAIHGDAVYHARVIYNHSYNQYNYFEDRCNYDSLVQSTGSSHRLMNTINRASSALLVYPNPSLGELIISFPNEGNVYIELKDVTGRVVHTQTILISDGSGQMYVDLPNGIYSVLAQTNNQIFTSKIVINK